MRRFLSALVGAALVLSMTGGVTAAASRSVFTGAWTSIDNDGSTQYLSVGGNATPRVTLIDLYASTCANNGARSTVFSGSGTGTINGTVLDVPLDRAACGSFTVSITFFAVTYSSGTDTLLDIWGVTWHRLP